MPTTVKEGSWCVGSLYSFIRGIPSSAHACVYIVRIVQHHCTPPPLTLTRRRAKLPRDVDRHVGARARREPHVAEIFRPLVPVSSDS
jgi:hypothetical protein